MLGYDREGKGGYAGEYRVGQCRVGEDRAGRVRYLD